MGIQTVRTHASGIRHHYDIVLISSYKSINNANNTKIQKTCERLMRGGEVEWRICTTSSRVGLSMGSLPGLLSRHSTHDGKVNAESGWGRFRRSGICREALFFKGSGPYVGVVESAARGSSSRAVVPTPGKPEAGRGRPPTDLIARRDDRHRIYLAKSHAARRYIPDGKRN